MSGEAKKTFFHQKIMKNHQNSIKINRNPLYLLRETLCKSNGGVGVFFRLTWDFWMMNFSKMEPDIKNRSPEFLVTY